MLATLITAALAIVAILLGAIVSGRFQERAAERQVRVSHGEAIRRDRLEAVTALACAASDHRTAMWRRGDAVLKGASPERIEALRSESHERGWLRCPTNAILGFWQPGYTLLTHAAVGLTLPDDIGMEPAHYALYIEARKRDDSLDGYTLLRLGPYTQTRHAQQDYDRLTAALDGRDTTLAPGFRVSARFGPFNVSDHQLFADPYEADAAALLDAAVAGVSA